MNITSILLYAHSGVRWLIILTALVTLGFFAYAWLAKKKAKKLSRILPAAYSGLLDAQAALGLVYMFLLAAKGAGFPRFRLEHMTVLILAVIVTHLPSRWRKKGSKNFERNTLLAVFVSLVLIYIGVAILPRGWDQ